MGRIERGGGDGGEPVRSPPASGGKPSKTDSLRPICLNGRAGSRRILADAIGGHRNQGTALESL